jgi:hypothetical protein
MYLASLLGRRVNKQFRDANKLPFATKQRDAALQAPHDRPDAECFGSESDSAGVDLEAGAVTG